MLDKILNGERYYAIQVLRRLETMNFSSKKLAEEYYKIIYDMVRSDLHGIEIKPIFRETMTVCVEGRSQGRRYMVWTVRIPMVERKFNTLN